jgi:large subunit ribosomal protein L27
MATKKAGGTAKNLRDSNPQYLGIKRADGQKVKVGEIIVRQRGTKVEAGKNVKMGKDHTLYAGTNGTVKFGTKRKVTFTGHTKVKKRVDVVA